MDIWKVRGGSRLEGACFVQGSKNASLPIIAASLICPAETELMNVPRLRDVDSALRILRHLGCSAEQRGNDVYINSAGISENKIPHALMLEMRSSVIFMGALLARCGEARLSLPGGCQLGARPIDIHISALRSMGAEIEEDGSNICCKASGLRGCELYLPFPSVGATENIMLAASCAEGETVINGAAREPEIEALAEYMRRLGCLVYGDGTDRIVIGGIKARPQVSHRVISDRIVASTIACAVACAGGDVELRAVDSGHFSTVLHFLKSAGCDIICDKYNVRLRSEGRLKAVGGVCTQPYPGFPTDAQPVLMAALLRAEGRTVITENIFENRYRQAGQLCRMGADIRLRGRVAEIRGVESLRGTVLEATDLRGGAAMIVAGLNADGLTEIHDEGHIKRGYEDFDEVLHSLGADIKLCEMKGTADGFQYTNEKTQN